MHFLTSNPPVCKNWVVGVMSILTMQRFRKRLFLQVIPYFLLEMYFGELHVFKLEMFFVDILFPEMSKVILAFQICEKFGNFGKSELTLTLKSFSTNACLLGAILPKFKGYSKI